MESQVPAEASAEPVRVLYLIDQLCQLGGAERALVNTVRLLPRDRFQCSVATFRMASAGWWAETLGCPIHFLPLTRTYDWNAARQAMRLRRLIRHERIAIVHTFFETSDLFGGMIARLSGCRVLISSRRDMGILRARFHWPAYRLFRPLFDQVQTVSAQVAEFMIRHDGLDPSRVVTVYSGINLAEVDAARPDAQARSALQPVPAAPIIVTVANVRPVKGLDVLVRAAAILAPRYPDARFVIAGEILDQGCFEGLRQLADSLGVGGQVVFPGKSSNVFGLLKASDLFCLPSRSEGFSNALLEAMACGLPCVATDVGGNREAVAEAVTGYLTPSEDPGALAARIDRFLSDRSLAASMGAAARHRVEDFFTTEAMVRRLASLYGSLLQSHT